MTEIKISLQVQIGEATYSITDSNIVDTEEWDADGVANEHLDCLTYRLKAALEPCYWDHETMIAKAQKETP